MDTPEAVAKWIADRKKRWPSKKVVEEKEKAREERIKAGLEEAPRVRGAGRGRGRGRGGMMDSSSGRGGGRGGYSSGSQVRERETETRMDEAEEPAKKKLKTEQDHSSASSSASDSSSGSGSDLDSEEEENDDGPEAIPAVSKEALKALLGDEAGEDEDDESDVDVDAPVEEQSSKPTEGNSATPASDSAQPPTKRFQVVCRHWRKGNCALGDVECPYLHSVRSLSLFALSCPIKADFSWFFRFQTTNLFLLLVAIDVSLDQHLTIRSRDRSKTLSNCWKNKI